MWILLAAIAILGAQSTIGGGVTQQGAVYANACNYPAPIIAPTINCKPNSGVNSYGVPAAKAAPAPSPY